MSRIKLYAQPDSIKKKSCRSFDKKKKKLKKEANLVPSPKIG